MSSLGASALRARALPLPLPLVLPNKVTALSRGRRRVWVCARADLEDKQVERPWWKFIIREDTHAPLRPAPNEVANPEIHAPPLPPTSEQEDGNELTRITFSAGCFWCVQADVDDIKATKKSRVGYTGGAVEQPSYADVATDKTGHVEAVEVLVDSSFDEYLDIVLRDVVDTKDGRGQGANRGWRYRPCIFYHDDAQKVQAEAAVLRAGAGAERNVRVRPASTFYEAEAEHQNYYERNDPGEDEGMPTWMGAFMEDPIDDNPFR
ncbi:peptide-methionine (S)-S-oxide reductase [Pseudoscourfieldia marina]